MENKKEPVYRELTSEEELMIIEDYKTHWNTTICLYKFNISRRQAIRLFKASGVFKSTSDIAKMRIGEKNPFYGKHHKEETKNIFRDNNRKLIAERNPNYKHGKYKRRKRDYRIVEIKPVRLEVFKRDSFCCVFCNEHSDKLHAHHLIPYWVNEELFLDKDNLITVCRKCHFDKCHLRNWQNFNVEIIPEELLKKYSIDRERLNEMTL